MSQPLFGFNRTVQQCIRAPAWTNSDIPSVRPNRGRFYRELGGDKLTTIAAGIFEGTGASMTELWGMPNITMLP